MLTASQIKWAASHDWFQSDNRDGSVTVCCCWVNVRTGERGDEVVTFSDFKALRDWAGY